MNVIPMETSSPTTKSPLSEDRGHIDLEEPRRSFFEDVEGHKNKDADPVVSKEEDCLQEFRSALKRNDAISPQVADVIEKVMSEDKSLLNQQNEQKYKTHNTPPSSLDDSDSMPPQSSSQSFTLNTESYNSSQAIPTKEGLYFCHLCSFSGRTAQEFDHHMTCHFEHVCPHCDYKSRTEGRLKRHIKDFHTDDPSDLKQHNMPGRPKVYRCKQCEYVATNKNEFWQHSRSHIKEEKLLQCPKCPFVTEYKHHLEYHLRNHFGSKPFKCNKCNYACVNKSMLNSHMKSHTNVYQYRCADCTYATKYCHSLKLHLHKYNHKPATVLNMDGSLPHGVDAEASGLSLLSKRGPPRGPRGPRKDKLDPFVGHLLGFPHTSMPMMSPGSMSNSIMSPYWPLMNHMPNGLQRAPMPPLLPVSMNSHHSTPTSPDNMAALHHSLKSNFSGTFRCRFCSLATDSREILNHHIVKVHAAENRDLFTMFGISSDTLLEDHNHRRFSHGLIAPNHNFSAFDSTSQEHPSPIKALQDSSQDLHVKTEPDQIDGMKSSPHSWPRDSSEESQRQKMAKSSSHSMPELYSQSNGKISPDRSEENSIDIIKQMTLKFGSGLPEHGPPINGEIPLDLTKRKTFSSTMFSLPGPQPHKNKQDEPESHLSVENSICADASPSSPPKKRSRKGKAYKLDRLCLKLQEQRGSPYNSDGDDDLELHENFENGFRDTGEGYTDSLSNEGSVAMETSPDAASPNDREQNDFDEADMEMQMRLKAVDDECINANGELPKSEYDQIHSSLDMLNSEKIVNDKMSSHENGGLEIQNGTDNDHDSQPPRSKWSNGVEEYTDLLSTPSANKCKNGSTALRKGTELAWQILNNENMPLYSGINGTCARDVELAKSRHDQPNGSITLPLCTSTPKTKLPQPVSSYECQYCDISFRDCVMYTMHMGYHGYKDPYKCNMCGQNSGNKVEFFLHIARAAHN